MGLYIKGHHFIEIDQPSSEFNHIPKCKWFKCTECKVLAKNCSTDNSEEFLSQLPKCRTVTQQRERLPKTSKLPSIPQRARRYIKERRTWVQKGKPMRSQELIDYIYHEHCKDCYEYNGTSCNICGCMINTGTNLNKIAWATTNCPAEPPKWDQETKIPPDYQSDKPKKEAQKVSPEPQNKKKRKKKKKGCGCN